MSDLALTRAYACDSPERPVSLAERLYVEVYATYDDIRMRALRAVRRLSRR